MNNTILLCINSCLYFVTFFFMLKKKGWGVYTFVLLFYATISIGSIYLFNLDSVWSFSDITFFPLCYLFMILMLFMRPLYHYSSGKTVKLKLPNPQLMKILSWIVVIVYMIFFLQTILSSFSLSDLFNAEILAENYENKSQNVGVDDSTINIFGIFKNLFTDILWLLFMYNWIKGNKFLAIGLLFSLIVAVFTALAWGARGPIMNILLDIPFMYFVFRKSMTAKMCRIFIYSIIFFIAIALLGFVGLTIGRFEDSADFSMFDIIVYYSSSNFLQFDNYALDANGIRYGDRVFPIFRLLLGLDITGNYLDRRLVYSDMLLDDSQFSFFVGEFLLDYGPFWGFIILTLFSMLLYKGSYSRGQYSLSNLLILSLAYRICVAGFSLFPYSELGGNIALIYILVFYAFFKLAEKYQFVRFKIRK